MNKYFTVNISTWNKTVYNDHKVQGIYSGLNRGKERLPWGTVTETATWWTRRYQLRRHRKPLKHSPAHMTVLTQKRPCCLPGGKEATAAKEGEVKSGSRWAWRGRQKPDNVGALQSKGKNEFHFQCYGLSQRTFRIAPSSFSEFLSGLHVNTAATVLPYVNSVWTHQGR